MPGQSTRYAGIIYSRTPNLVGHKPGIYTIKLGPKGLLGSNPSPGA